MNNTKLKQLILKVLKKDDRLWNEDKTELNQTLLLDLIEKIDETVIDLLLQEKDLREKFFVKIKDVFVFKTNDFRFFMEENKVDNSYTVYKNRIGLTDAKKFLKDTNDVVLDFPYKDCVLEGGQSTEEGTDTYFEYEEEKTKTVKGEKVTEEAGYKEKQGKRKEIFFNSVLAHDEIDRLFDHKALTNWKRFTKNGEQDVKEIKRDEDGTIKENLVIKGNNLLALHSLKKQFAGKVKLIYIDPPYNTGNDGFKYNDNFNHSTWLTFMKNRLEVARELLRDDGVIFVQCDDNEQAYLKVLMDDVFCKSNFVETFIWKNTDNAPTLSKKTRKNIEFIHCFEKRINTSTSYKGKDSENDDAPLINTGNPSTVLEFPSEIIHFKITDGTYNKGKYDKVELLDDLIVKNGLNQTKVRIKGNFKWQQSFLEGEIEKGTYFLIKTNKFSIRYQRKIASNVAPEKLLTNSYLSKAIGIETNEDSKKHIDKMSLDFDSYPKPETLMYFLINAVSEPNDIVLDYHLGSGTTCAVAHKMDRQYIGIEQMDYIETIACERMKKVIDGEQGGISKSVNWKDGGDFIYFELAKWNETAKEKILECESLEELIKFFDEMYERYFLNYNLKIKEFREKVIHEEEFKNLSLDEQKKMFVAMLDNNQMYVNKTEMTDKKFGISKEDQKLTSQFYNSEK